jgi:hypothetical protein
MVLARNGKRFPTNSSIYILSQFCRDADFIFYTIMEYQKHCLGATPDAAKGNQTFMATVTSKFTPEAFHTLRRYMGTMPDVKNVINLQLRGQKFTDAGITMARRALEKKGDPREKHSILAVRTNNPLTVCCMIWP